ncbi:bifunctional precorrin-2 dehydrogenase/sirohydrochlorin ferrochelatase [Sphingomonas sp. LM7]|uniref:precorrin-2 dehydrogenase/sirohydrochlorin ferrochelatase family protein n=1 Tax=Sphingomonas sp. LM7 TaxID=1938607 RepID=UPI00098408A3|nr:bifunctional precorrin-2 dehydrogenase/sirohydrochlorin ferrochelatase [Sphingomonas sp. LM7]AQR74504.1 siroheme synthase [Sphingomonas sp. LM7]
MSLAALPIFVKLAGRPVILIGEGEAAEAKRRLLERAGADVVDEAANASLAIVAIDDPEPIVVRLRGRGILVNTVDRVDLCDFTLPAIVDRDPVLVAIGTGGVSAGLAAALRQRLEAVLPASLGGLARALEAAKPGIRGRWPGLAERRRALGAGLAGPLDPLTDHPGDAVEQWLTDATAATSSLLSFYLPSYDPDDLTLRQARALAQADRVFHRGDVPEAILDRARADAIRIACGGMPLDPGAGLSVYLAMGE